MRKESKYHILVGGRTTDSKRSMVEIKKRAIVFSSIANIVWSRVNTYSNMQKNLIDHAVASSATYRDAKEEVKKKDREREGEKREWSKGTERIAEHNGHDITIGITRAEK